MGSEAPRRSVKILAACLILALTVLAAEVGLRIYHWVLYDVSPTSLIAAPPQEKMPRSPFLIFGPRVDWEIPDRREAELAYFDERGLRTTEPVGPRPEGETRVLVLGGSTTENVWNETGLHWPWATECLMRERGRTDLRVLNGAMSAYTTAHSIVRLALDLVDVEPTMLVVMHNANDLSVNYDAFARGTAVDPNYLVKYGRKAYTGFLDERDVAAFRTLRAITNRLRRIGVEPPPPVEGADIEEGLRVFRRNLRTLAGLSREYGIRLVLLTMPVSISAERYSEVQDGADQGGPGIGPGPVGQAEYLRHFEAYNDAIRSFAAGRDDVDLVDMAAHVTDDDFFVDTIHYTEAGVAAFGRALADGLEELMPTPASGTQDPAYAPHEACALLNQY